MLAIAHARTAPPIDKEAVDLVQGDDLFLDLGHELKVVGPQPACYPHLRRGPVASPVSGGVDGDPIGVRVVNVVVSSMRISSCDHDHSKLSAAGYQLAKRVCVAKPAAAMVQWNPSGIVRDTSAGAQANSIRPSAPEVIQPELRIELTRIVFDKSKLRPTHRFVDP